MGITLDTDSLRYIAAMEKVSGAEVKDCIVDGGTITYVIKQGQMGVAIGKGGVNVKRLTTALGKKVHIVELNSDPLKFISNLAGSVKLRNMEMKEITSAGQTTRKLFVETDQKDRGTLVGKGGKNIEMIKSLLKRHHEIEDVVVR